MLAKKRKLTKKEIKEDKLVTSYFKVQQFYEEYRTRILSIVGAVALVIVVYVVYTNKVEQENLEATTQLSRIMEVYNTGSYQEAIDGRPGTNLIGLKSIADEYGGTEQGENAKIYLANSYYNLGNFESSEEYFKSYSGDNFIFKATALAGIAACKEAAENYDAAADYYNDAANVNTENPLNSEYLLKSGINLKKSGNTEKAKDVFEYILEEYPGSTGAIEAEKYLGTVTD